MLRVLGRVLVVAFGCLLAAVASLFVVVTLGLEKLTRAAHGAGGDDAVDTALALARIGGALLDALVALPSLVVLPALALVVVGEIARIRSPLFYIAGGGLALASAVLLPRFTAPADVATTATAAWQVLATAGFGGGLVYWLVAGRRA